MTNVSVVDEPGDDADLVVDALVGYSLLGPPRGSVADSINWMNRGSAPVLALDTPSGLDVTSGLAPGPVTEATATLTLALPKRGLRNQALVGELYLADISVPALIYEQLGITRLPSFRSSPILRVAA